MTDGSTCITNDDDELLHGDKSANHRNLTPPATAPNTIFAQIYISKATLSSVAVPLSSSIDPNIVDLNFMRMNNLSFHFISGVLSLRWDWQSVGRMDRCTPSRSSTRRRWRGKRTLWRTRSEYWKGTLLLTEHIRRQKQNKITNFLELLDSLSTF